MSKDETPLEEFEVFVSEILTVTKEDIQRANITQRKDDPKEARGRQGG